MKEPGVNGEVKNQFFPLTHRCKVAVNSQTGLGQKKASGCTQQAASLHLGSRIPESENEVKIVLLQRCGVRRWMRRQVKVLTLQKWTVNRNYRPRALYITETETPVFFGTWRNLFP